MINTIKFEYLMVEKLGLSLKECTILIQVLDYMRNNVVEYKTLLSFMTNRDKIYEYFDKILNKK